MKSVTLRSKYNKLVLCCKLKFSSDPPEGHEEHCLDSYILTSGWVWGGVQGSNSHSKSGVDHAHAGHENTGSTRLAFGTMITAWLCTTHLFPSANQLLPWKSSFSSQRSELFKEEFQTSCYNSGTQWENLSAKLRKVVRVLLFKSTSLAKAKVLTTPRAFTVVLVRWLQGLDMVMHCLL